VTFPDAIAKAMRQLEAERASDDAGRLDEIADSLDNLREKAARLDRERGLIEARLSKAVPLADVFVRAWRILNNLESDGLALADLEWATTQRETKP